MYYACYYAASALLVANKITTKSHDGVRQMFSLHFVKTGKLPKEYGRYYSSLFDKRITGDYEDLFDHNLATCDMMYPTAKDFVATVGRLVDEWLSKNG